MSSTSLPGRRATGTDVQCNRNSSKMGVHSYISTPITSLGPNAEPSPPVTIDNTTTFTFLRLSAEDSPVISRMIVNHVSFFFVIHV